MRLLRRTVADVLGIYLTLIEGAGRPRIGGEAVRQDAFTELFEAYSRIRSVATDSDFLRTLEEACSLALQAHALRQQEGDDERVRGLLLRSREAFWSIAEAPPRTDGDDP